MPNAVAVFHQFRVWATGLFFGFSKFEILPLHIPDFGDHDDFVTTNLTRGDKLGQYGSHQSFAVAIRVIRRGVDEIARSSQRLFKRFAVLRILHIDAIGAEP